MKIINKIGGTQHWFDDREIARQWLYDHAVLPRELLDSDSPGECGLMLNRKRGVGTAAKHEF